ncbi:Ribonuclease H domain [Sesbania bispinosa]|nr:Ribonuclease H domain [Sesbania bispinosa]
MTTDMGDWDVEKFKFLIPNEVLDEVLGMVPPNADSGEDTIAWSLTNNGRFSTKSAYHLGGLKTNSFRFSRKLTDSAICSICNSHAETPLHALRDCSKARDIWNLLGVMNLEGDFFSYDIMDWIYRNIMNTNSSYDNIPWPTVFVSTLSTIWLNRNQSIFSAADTTVRELHRLALTKATDYNHAADLLRLKHIWIETDSKTALDLIHKGVDSHHPCASIIRAISSLLNKDWTVKISHEFREGNRAADWLAEYAFNFSLGYHFLSDPPLGICPILRDDIVGVAFYRGSCL